RPIGSAICPEITQNNRFSGAKPLLTENPIELSSSGRQSAHASAAPPGGQAPYLRRCRMAA
ncbi:MAG: hypothetical protein KHZ34_25620, partial [Klebsiella sp.]|uniref:hypothetical protein n=1 Tax=Klebsiella sp. TaxID=576 RepID=UPI00258EF3C2